MNVGVEFHTGVADPVGFACRLLRKAHRQGARVAVTAPEPLLAQLDQALWTFDAQAFVPHVRVPGPTAALAERTPIWLLAGDPPAGAPVVRINLGAEPPPSPDGIERLIEVVGDDPDVVAGGRARWRVYEGWGIKPVHHAAR